MLDIYFNSQSTVSKLRSGPGGAQLDGFASWLRESGFALDFGSRLIRGANLFATWGRSKQLNVNQLDESALDLYREHLAACNRLKYPAGQYTKTFRGARYFVTFLRESHVLVSLPPAAKDPALPQQVLDFCHWMRTQRGVKQSTTELYKPYIVNLLESIGNSADFTAENIRDFVFDQIRRCGTAKAKTLVASVRMFLRFLVAIGKCKPGIDYAVPTIAQWQLSALPKYLQPEQVKKIIDGCDQSTASGARGRAAILLMSVLGLRAGDVAGLELGDINWKEGVVRVSGKSRRETLLPLPDEPRDALRHYLDHYRPSVDSNKVFISLRAPFGPVSSQVVSYIARQSIQRVQVEAPSYGAHVFRHSAATEMLRDGASLQAIGAVLRHVSIETTAHYAKVDVELLHEVAMPWPEVKSC